MEKPTSTVNTFVATLHVGLKVRRTGEIHPLSKAKEIIQAYTDGVGLCATVTETDYIYTKGSEPGIIVGFINYPRFPASATQISQHVSVLATKLMIGLNQLRVTIVYPDTTVMFTNREEIELNDVK